MVPEVREAEARPGARDGAGGPPEDQGAPRRLELREARQGLRERGEDHAGVEGGVPEGRLWDPLVSM